MFRLEIKSEEKTFTVSWRNEEEFEKFQIYQRSTFIPASVKLKSSPYYPYATYITSDNVKESIQYMYEILWQREIDLKIFDNLPIMPKILDIGSGIGVINMLAYQYLDRNAIIHLLDKNDEIKFLSAEYDKDYYFYHSWKPVEDAIETSGFDKECFKFFHPEDEWTVKYDLIASRGSWCWHFPLEAYWDKVKNHLNIGGKLLLNVSLNALEKENIIEIISESFDSNPTIVPMQFNERPTGYECVWIRNK